MIPIPEALWQLGGPAEAFTVTPVAEQGEVTRIGGRLQNTSAAPQRLTALFARFRLNHGEYQVYTQYNGWQSESLGGWQPLVSSVSASSESIRSARDAAPFLALWNEQTARGIAFHLLPRSGWEMQVSRRYLKGEFACVEVELGLPQKNLSLTLKAGELLELPEILCYEFTCKRDMDCHKLHRYLHRRAPRRELPVIYNSWLYKFDRFTPEELLVQAEKAAALGVEYFVIDAGWFGEGENWSRARGDWEENQTFGIRGRMREVSQKVRSLGMKFGFWLEPESASKTAKIVKEHPDWFLEGKSQYFLNFAHPDAFRYILDTTCRLIERYHASYIKFDFNDDLFGADDAFIAYHQGHKAYLCALRERYPALYLESCASGGNRMVLSDGLLFDSFWLSDNQSPYHGVRIFKDTLLRMPPQWIECWAAVTSTPPLTPIYDSCEKGEKLIAANDATWDSVTGVRPSFLKGFLTGNPVGLTCDLAALSPAVFEELREFIAAFKRDRAFWMGALCHILADTPSVQVLEFRNEELSRIELVIFTFKTLQNHLQVYPVADPHTRYLVNGEARSGESLWEDGIDVAVSKSYDCIFISLKGEQ